MKKTLALVSMLALAACGAQTPVETFKPLDYSYLRPITLKVATVNVVDNYVPSPAETTLNANNPAPPGETLASMLSHRMQPSGQPGTGTITVQVASINEAGGNLNGQMTVDVNLTSPDGRSTGFTEASVSSSQTAPDSDASPNDVQAALYLMTKKLMDAMNVQLQYQIQRNIPNWVAWSAAPGGVAAAPQSGPGVVPGSIQAAPLSAPGAGAAAPSVPASGAGGTPNYLPGAGPAALGAPQ